MELRENTIRRLGNDNFLLTVGKKFPGTIVNIQAVGVILQIFK